MIILRQGKAKSILENSINSALTAVETYNRPRVQFRIENYIILMILHGQSYFMPIFKVRLVSAISTKRKIDDIRKLTGKRSPGSLLNASKNIRR